MGHPVLVARAAALSKNSDGKGANGGLRSDMRDYAGQHSGDFQWFERQ